MECACLGIKHKPRVQWSAFADNNAMGAKPSKWTLRDRATTILPRLFTITILFRINAGLPGIWGRKSPEEVGEDAKTRHRLRQKISDDLKQTKKGRRSGQVSKTSYTLSIIIDFQLIDNRYKSILDPPPLPPRTRCYIHTAFEWPFYGRQIGCKNSPKTPNARQQIANKSPNRHRRFFGAKCTSQVSNLATSRQVWQPCINGSYTCCIVRLLGNKTIRRQSAQGFDLSQGWFNGQLFKINLCSRKFLGYNNKENLFAPYLLRVKISNSYILHWLAIRI